MSFAFAFANFTNWERFGSATIFCVLEKTIKV